MKFQDSHSEDTHIADKWRKEIIYFIICYSSITNLEAVTETRSKKCSLHIHFLTCSVLSELHLPNTNTFSSHYLSQNSLLRNIFDVYTGAITSANLGNCGPTNPRIRNNQDFRELYKGSDIVADLNKKIMECIGHLVRMDHGRVYKKIIWQ
jgi:hypothetical protein